MYDWNRWSKLMEPEVKLIGIVRSPYLQFKSYFNYFQMGAKMAEKRNVSLNDSFDEFLRKPQDKLLNCGYQNPMLFDFGYKDKDEKKTFWKKYVQSKSIVSNHVMNYVEELKSNFTLILVSDYFDESMVLLRHEMCWTMREILLKSKNKSKRDQYNLRTTTDVKEQRRKELYKAYASADHYFFDQINQTFWEKISKIDKFEEQLADYRNVTQHVNNYCTMLLRLRPPTMKIESNDYHEKMEIDIGFCKSIAMGVIKQIEMLKTRQLTRPTINMSDFMKPAIFKN